MNCDNGKKTTSKATFDDYKACIYIANVQFRAAKYIVKSLKHIWFDTELSEVIRKLEKCYATTVVFLAGLIGLCYGSVFYSSTWQGVMLFVLWVILDSLVISPLIYLPFVPKPVRKHMKDIDKLTPEEQQLRDEELMANGQLDGLIKKYKNYEENYSEDAKWEKAKE